MISASAASSGALRDFEFLEHVHHERGNLDQDEQPQEPGERQDDQRINQREADGAAQLTDEPGGARDALQRGGQAAGSQAGGDDGAVSGRQGRAQPVRNSAIQRLTGLEARAQFVREAAQSAGHVAGQFAESAIERDAGARSAAISRSRRRVDRA